MVFPLIRTPRLPVVDWTDSSADLNGLVHFSEWPNPVSARVPSLFKRALPTLWRTIFVKPVVAERLKKYPIIYRTRKCDTVFKRNCLLSSGLSKLNPTQIHQLCFCKRCLIYILSPATRTPGILLSPKFCPHYWAHVCLLPVFACLICHLIWINPITYRLKFAL